MSAEIGNAEKPIAVKENAEIGSAGNGSVETGNVTKENAEIMKDERNNAEKMNSLQT